MNRENEKRIESFVIYNSFIEAAENLKWTGEQYKEYLLNMRDYAVFGIDRQSEDPYINAVLVMSKPNVKAATDRYAKNKENGKYGELGKDFGSKGGRPRKGETPKEYRERKSFDEARSDQKPPENPLNINTTINTNTNSNKNNTNNNDTTNTLDINKNTTITKNVGRKEKEYFKDSIITNQDKRNIISMEAIKSSLAKDNVDTNDNYCETTNRILDKYDNEIFNIYQYLTQRGLAERDQAQDKLIGLTSTIGNREEYTRVINELFRYARLRLDEED